MITLATIDTILQRRLVNTVNSPLDQTTRVLGINDAIQFMQAHANFNPTKRIATFDYLSGESDYSIVNGMGISDYKALKMIRLFDETKNRSQFEHSDENDLTLRIGNFNLHNAFTIEERDNDDVLRMTFPSSKERKIVAALDSLTEDGTWAIISAANDGSALAVDANRFIKGAASLGFTLGNFTQGFGGIENTTLSSIDADDLENIGHWRGWLDLRSLTDANLALISGMTLRFGSDTTANYWQVVITTTVNNGSFKQDWNRVDFDWANAIKVGSPSASAIDSIQLRVNTLAGFTSTTNIRLDELVLIEPETFEFIYYSSSFVKDGSTWQTEFSTDPVDTTEQLLLPTRHRDNFIRLCIDILKSQKNVDDRSELQKQKEMFQIIRPIVADIGGWIVREASQIRPQGLSSGRSESKMW
jgi:hypothetical protein